MNEAERARFEELGAEVLAPLLWGGEIRPVRPMGAKLALSVSPDFRLADEALESRIGVARVRRARILAPIDVLDPLSAREWALVAGLSDLLQASNHQLSSIVTRSRHRLLLESFLELTAKLPGPETIREVIARHATFARLLEVVRRDVRVSWWTGSAHFRGEPVQSRLLLWPELRRVHTEERYVSIPEMAADLPPVPQLGFDEGLRALLAQTPLTDIATAGRAVPEFAWTSGTLALVASSPGSTLAARAVERGAKAEAMAALRAATERLEPGSPPRLTTSGFLRDLDARSRHAHAS